MNKTILLSLFGSALLAGSAFSAEAKIAVVDIASVIKAHPKTKVNEELIQEEVSEFESVQKEMLEAIEKIRDEFKTLRDSGKNSALNEKAREEKNLLAEEKYIELRKFEQQARERVLQRQKELNDQQMRMQKRLVSAISGILKEYAKKKGYDKEAA